MSNIDRDQYQKNLRGLITDVLVDRNSADETERASCIEALAGFSFLSEVSRRVEPQVHVGFDGIHCVNPECGEDLPKARIENGRIYCVTCQTEKERKATLHGKPYWSV